MRKVIAVVFDGTLFEDRWPEIGAPIWPVINAAKKESQNGTELILWTTREGEKLTEALEACGKVGLRFDAVNSNTESRKLEWGNDPRKIGADEYWDDRAVPVKNLVHKEEEPEEAVKALRLLSVETGSLACLGCGHEHSCSTRGCAILHDAADQIESLKAKLAAFTRLWVKAVGENHYIYMAMTRNCTVDQIKAITEEVIKLRGTQQVPTHADYFRSVSDEEMASNRVMLKSNGRVFYYGDFEGECVTYKEAVQKEVEWLRQPAEV